ncbi:hypothetical protein WN55_10915 [Dufourea novaeangliae]|uniref:Uncharacterized protein n=1 Tax=Dufourea novaeangliae TaxID=178035 RepID=A0A154PBD8_DUFNO|nr:hypothetical protein WN55_10915 [Dufourea novaeangliae]
MTKWKWREIAKPGDKLSRSHVTMEFDCKFLGRPRRGVPFFCVSEMAKQEEPTTSGTRSLNVTGANYSNNRIDHLFRR